MATAIEAIIGAIYFSHGFDACQDFVKRTILTRGIS
jgi:dsRNA-specific ribonuclease